jgi:hypothetical protein
MKKLFVILLLFCAFEISFSQEVFFATGKNLTNYNFKNSSGSTNPNIIGGSGSFFEVGFTNKTKNKNAVYSLGLALNEYNSIGGDSFSRYSWETNYLGIQTRYYYSFFDSQDLDIVPTIGFNISTLINGQQTIDASVFDLTKEKEFAGVVVTPSLGIQIKYNLSENGFISFGYNYGRGFNLTNFTDQKLGFSTHQLQFGVHYFLNSCCD